jgi:hypothetical protein
MLVTLLSRREDLRRHLASGIEVFAIDSKKFHPESGLALGFPLGLYFLNIKCPPCSTKTVVVVPSEPSSNTLAKN